MTNLSLAAQALLDAYEDSSMSASLDGANRKGLAATLRAVAEQFFTDWDGMCCAEHLKAIADELEGTVYGTYRCKLETPND